MLDFEIDFLLQVFDFVGSGTGYLPGLQQKGQSGAHMKRSVDSYNAAVKAHQGVQLSTVLSATNLRTTRNGVQGCFKDDLHSTMQCP